MMTTKPSTIAKAMNSGSCKNKERTINTTVATMLDKDTNLLNFNVIKNADTKIIKTIGL